MRFKDSEACAIWAEAEAISDGLLWAIVNNSPNVIIESDCACH